MTSISDIEAIAEKEIARREKRNIRDRLAREFLKEHPEVKDDPDNAVISDKVPMGTTEAAVRAFARNYRRQRNVRNYIKRQGLLEDA